MPKRAAIDRHDLPSLDRLKKLGKPAVAKKKKGSKHKYKEIPKAYISDAKSVCQAAPSMRRKYASETRKGQRMWKNKHKVADLATGGAKKQTVCPYKKSGEAVQRMKKKEFFGQLEFRGSKRGKTPKLRKYWTDIHGKKHYNY